MKILEETVSFVASGIVYNIPIMRKIIDDNCKYNHIKITEIPPKFNTSEDLSDDVYKQLMQKLPIAIFTNDEYLNISIINNEAKLVVQDIIIDFEKTRTLSKIFESLLIANVDNFENLQSITISYTRNYDAEGVKLKLLNEDIEDVEDWEKNQTFILTIPFDYGDHTALYKIQKLLPVSKQDSNRYYQISASYNYKLDSNDKQSELKTVIELHNDKILHGDFIKKANYFMGLKYDKIDK